MKVDTANVYYDHPYEAQLDHALCVDFVCEAQGGRERVAIEISRELALELIEKIKAALASGDDAHGKAAQASARWPARVRRWRACSDRGHDTTDFEKARATGLFA